MEKLPPISTLLRHYIFVDKNCVPFWTYFTQETQMLHDHWLHCRTFFTTASYTTALWEGKLTIRLLIKYFNRHSRWPAAYGSYMVLIGPNYLNWPDILIVWCLKGFFRDPPKLIKIFQAVFCRLYCASLPRRRPYLMLRYVFVNRAHKSW